MRINNKHVIIAVLLIIIAYLLITEPSGTVANYNAGFLDPGGTADRLCNAWCGRISGAFILSMLCGAGYYYYDYRMYAVEAQTEIERARIDAEMEQTRTLVEPQVKPRVIPFNSSQSTLIHSGTIRLTEALSIPKNDLIQFVTESVRDDGVGLVISKWKNDLGWDQSRLENLLDWLHQIGLITERSSGRSCEYTGKYSATELLKIISERAYEIG